MMKEKRTELSRHSNQDNKKERSTNIKSIFLGISQNYLLLLTFIFNFLINLDKEERKSICLLQQQLVYVNTEEWRDTTKSSQSITQCVQLRAAATVLDHQ